MSAVTRFDRFFLTVIVAALVVANAACLVRTEPPPPVPLATRTAGLEELLSKLDSLDAIESLRSRVHLQLSVLTQDRQKIKAYPESDGLVLIRRPSSIRVRAEFPVVGSTVFDITSDGTTFSVHLPTKNRYLVGLNELSKPSRKREENVRPQHILEALVVDARREDEELAVLENASYGPRAYHVVVFIRKTEFGYRLSRKIWFDRVDLDIARQQVYDLHGDVVTDAWYREWAPGEPIRYPTVVEINRPADGYVLTVRFLRWLLHVDVPEEGFVLKPPEGVKIEEIGQSDEEEGSEKDP